MKRQICIQAAGVLAAFVLLAAPGAPALPAAGERVDLAAFGERIAGEDFVGVAWENPREVEEVRAVFQDPRRAPAPDALKLEWWGSVWPNHGSGGWMRLDDPWNGRWVPVQAKAGAGPAPGILTFKFPPLSRAEWKEASTEGLAFRKTLQVILRGPRGSLPDSLQAFGRSVWREGSFDIELRLAEDGERTGRLEVRNGILASIESLPEPRAVDLEGSAWKARGATGSSAGVRLKVLHAEARDRSSNDLTRVTVRLGSAPDSTGFSFVPQDVLQEGAIRLPAFGALVSESGRGIALASDPGPAGEVWSRPVRRRLAGRPEMTREMALEGIPRLSPPRPVPLGVSSARQEVVVTPLGDWSFSKESLHTPGRDSGRIPFRKNSLDAVLDTRPEPLFDGGDREGASRRLEEGRLPLIHVEWRTGPVRFHHALCATILQGELGDDEARRGDETVALLTKLEMENLSGEPRKAAVSLRYSHDAPIALRDDGTVAIEVPPGQAAQVEGLAALRGVLSADRASGGGAGGNGGGWSLRPAAAAGTSQILRWEATLAPRGKRVLYFKAAYVDLLEPAEAERLKAMSFEEEAPRVLGYWRKRLEAGMAIETPCRALNDFYAANLWHVLITTDRDPQTLLFNQGVATFNYRVFANETVMIARSMDARGESREAERFLEPLLRFQGSEPLTGRFSTKEGVFHGAGAYTHGQYAMNHGFTLWGIADHYLFTRDRAYLERVAPKVLEACDFLIRERRSTFSPAGGPRSPVHGLAPASSLEDVIEFQYWFATNGYFHLGLRRAGQALAAAGHPEAGRILREAELYRRDIERAAREAATRAAAVRLRDGSWIPYVPSRVFQWRHLTEGWIREALYPALHLATAEVVAPSDPLMTWMLDELEDNTFFSAESGYGVKDVDALWFERGAVTLQPCLLDTPAIYLARDEIPAALRSFWNTYALSIYLDVQCFAEWAKAFGVGGGPVYKTSDESRFVLWLRQLLLWEDGDRLWFGRGAPREWLEDGKAIRAERARTVFGAAGLEIRSEANRGRIRAGLEIPARDRPREVWLRLRHPRGKVPLRVLRADGSALEAGRILGEDILVLGPGDEIPAGKLELTAEYAP